MSTTLSAVRAAVRHLLRDRDASRHAFSSWEVDRAIERNMRGIAAQARMGQEWTTLAVTDATDTYAMPGSLAYAQVLAVRRQVDAYTLRGPLPREEFDMWREGQTSPSQAKGDPERYTLWEIPAGGLQVQFHPWPGRAQTLDILRSTLPSALSADADEIPFDDALAEALHYRTATEMVAGAHDDALAVLRLDRGVLRVWERREDELLRDHRVRRARQRAAGTVHRRRRA